MNGIRVPRPKNVRSIPMCSVSRLSLIPPVNQQSPPTPFSSGQRLEMQWRKNDKAATRDRSMKIYMRIEKKRDICRCSTKSLRAFAPFFCFLRRDFHRFVRVRSCRIHIDRSRSQDEHVLSWNINLPRFTVQFLRVYYFKVSYIYYVNYYENNN